MSITRIQDHQMVHDSALPILGKAARTQIKDIVDAVDVNAGSPCRLSAAFPTPDTKLYISANTITMADGSKKSTPPLKGTIPSLVAATVDFPTRSFTGPMDIEWPTATMVGYRRVGFTILSSGLIKAVWSAESASPSTVDPGTLFIKGSLPIGWVDLQQTAFSPAAWCGLNAVDGLSLTSADITNFGSGGAGGSSGTGDVTTILSRIDLMLADSKYQFRTAVDFAIDDVTATDSATATWDLVNSVYSFANGDVWTSSNLLNSEFTDTEISELELVAFWSPLGTIPTDAKYEVSGDGATWTEVTMVRNGTTDQFVGQVFFATPIATALQVRVTSMSAGGYMLAGVGVLLGNPTGQIATGLDLTDTKSFDGSTNPTTFAMTKFRPNNKLKVFLIETGQVFRFGAFTIDGMNVVFPADTFANAGMTYTLLFDMTEGGGFDNSDLNASLLAANHLGAADAGIDRSVAGQGVLLRSPNGTLYEITVRDDGGIDTYLVS